MELRSTLPVAVLFGSVIGAAAVGVNAPHQGQGAGSSASALLFSSASADAVSATWDLPVVQNAAVQRFVDIFTGKQSDRMALYLKRSGRFEGMIRSKLRERGMPEDLVYLSMIESGFNPNARSKAHAVGLWQFIEGTGEQYGLRIDGYVDERRDPEKSTDAALRYLQDLHTQFGSWYLAAAAYNTGGNRVSRAMRQVTGSEKGVEADFWRIRSLLPAETREYVPLMVAAALIGKEPHKYGHGSVERYLPPATETVEVPGRVDLEVVARAAGTSEKALKTLNPQLIRGVTPPSADGYQVKVPEGKAEPFAANFEREVAEARAVALAAAARAEVVRREALRVRKAKVASAAKSRGKAARGVRRVHRVREGESLWSIARRNETSVAAIKRVNGLRSSRVRPGQRLVLPG